MNHVAAMDWPAFIGIIVVFVFYRRFADIETKMDNVEARLEYEITRIERQNAQILALIGDLREDVRQARMDYDSMPRDLERIRDTLIPDDDYYPIP